MRKLKCDEALDDGTFPQISKAAWRRANDDRLESRRCARSLLKGGISSSCTSRRRARRAKANVKEGSKSASRGKAEKCVQLPEWYRNTLGQQLEAALRQCILDDNGPDSCDVSMSPEDFSSRAVSDAGRDDFSRAVSDVGRDAAMDMQHMIADMEPHASALSVDDADERQDEVLLPAAAVACSRPMMEDADTQCVQEDIVGETGEPVARSPIGRKMFFDKLKGPLWEDIPYSVALHFSLFEDPDIIAEQAENLNDTELEALADRFLGSEIGGVAIALKSRRPPRLVADRHVREAALLAQRAPKFRKGLLASARRLLLGSSRRIPPLNGRSLLKLADDSAEKWAKPAHTALNFACRLIQGRALPSAFAAEIIAVLADLTPAALLLGLSTVLPASRANCFYSSRHDVFRRSWSAPLRSLSMRSCPPVLTLRKTHSVPPDIGCSVRNVGTSSRPQDAASFQLPSSRCCEPLKIFVAAHSSLSFKEEYEDMCLYIEPCCLPDYWRFAAGGEHPAPELERRAQRAEDALSAALQCCNGEEPV